MHTTIHTVILRKNNRAGADSTHPTLYTYIYSFFTATLQRVL